MVSLRSATGRGIPAQWDVCKQREHLGAEKGRGSLKGALPLSLVGKIGKLMDSFGGRVQAVWINVAVLSAGV